MKVYVVVHVESGYTYDQHLAKVPFAVPVVDGVYSTPEAAAEAANDWSEVFEGNVNDLL